ncbi:MAG: PAS domain S-box protein [Verrucomicrobia bacterium]|nr:PAS domain S-box protein [Verrucomicrobiota bacterium]
MTSNAGNAIGIQERKRLPWGAYVLAVLLIPGTLLILRAVHVDFHPSPALIWCLACVGISAYAGGVPGGVLSLLSAVVCLWFVTGPFGTASSRPGLAESASFGAVALALTALIGRLKGVKGRGQTPTKQFQQHVPEQDRSDQGFDLLRAAVESANDAVIITTPNLDLPGPAIEYVNPVFTRMTGYTAAEVLGKTPRILQGPKTDRQVLDCLRRDLALKQSFHGETVNYRKDGSEYFVEWRISALRDLSGQVTHWVAIQQDVSERKQAERWRERLLESERAARAEAERVGRMKDEFLATLSHELRTPLNAILGWSHLLQSEHATVEDIALGLETIERNARAQSQLIEDLLDMSSIVSGKVRLNAQRYQLLEVVQAALDAVRPSIEAKGLTMEMDPKGFHRTLYGDPGRMQQVFWNLLSNAVKFTPSGGKVTVRERLAKDHVEVLITDTGQGIEPDFLPHVFDRFRQADASTTRHQAGLGLGLSIVRSLVEMHGGTVRAESAGRNLGATFIVALPDPASQRAAPGTPEVSSRALEPASLMRQNRALEDLSILVVEDDPDSREVLKRSLEAYGARVTGASSAREGFELLKREPPNVLVSDIGMPEVDGFELIRWVRALPAEQGGRVPAIAVTAYARPDDQRQTLIAGYQLYLAKPVEPTRLLQACISLIGPAGAPMPD